MDVKQAIGLLKHHIEAWEGKFPPAHFEACEAAIQALEKQVPKKAIYYPNNIMFECPSCGGDIVFDNEKEEHQYCLMCGQKLDWSEVDGQ